MFSAPEASVVPVPSIASLSSLAPMPQRSSKHPIATEYIDFDADNRWGWVNDNVSFHVQFANGDSSDNRRAGNVSDSMMIDSVKVYTVIAFLVLWMFL